MIEHFLNEGEIKVTCLGGALDETIPRKLRHIDFLYVPEREKPFALIHLTGSQKFNIKLRRIAKLMGYSLSEKGLRSLDENIMLEKNFHSEEEIFKFLGLNYIPPERRDLK